MILFDYKGYYDGALVFEELSKILNLAIVVGL